LVNRIEEIKLNYKSLIQKCVEIKRFRVFPLFSESDIQKYQTSSNKLIKRINRSLLSRLTDQVGGSIGVFRSLEDQDLIDLLNQTWLFLNKFIQFFLQNNGLIDKSYDNYVLEDEMNYNILQKNLIDDGIKEEIKSQIKYFYKAFSFFKIKLKEQYGREIWISLNDAVKNLTEEQKELLANIINHESFKMLNNLFDSEEVDNENIFEKAFNLVEQAQKSIGGSKAFVILRSLCINAKILRNNPLFLYNTIRKCFINIKYQKDNILKNSYCVQKGITLFLRELKNFGIKEIGENMASYYLRDLVTEKNHLDIIVNINRKEERFNTRFARYCFKKDTNASKFLVLTGLIMLPSFYYKEIDSLISKALLREKEQIKFRKCLDFVEHIKTAYLNENISWHELILKNKKVLDTFSSMNEIHIIVKISIDLIFDHQIEDESKYKENFGILNEIFYLKCQSQCNISSQYLCWKIFKPEIKNENPPILSFCNIAQYCLLTNVNNLWANLEDKLGENNKFKDFLNRLNPSYKNILENLTFELGVEPVKVYWGSIHLKHKNKKLIITAYTKKKLEFVFSRAKKADINVILKDLGITTFILKEKASNESYGDNMTPAIDYNINTHEFVELKKICKKWLEIV